MVNYMSGWAFVHFKGGKGGMQACFSSDLVIKSPKYLFMYLSREDSCMYQV